MRVNFFDLGMHKGLCTDWMIEIFRDLDISTYHVYGFEACETNYVDLWNKYRDNFKVLVFHRAIAQRYGMMKLYRAPNSNGHSIFETKAGMDPTNFEMVQGISFVNWMRQNVPSYEYATNILKANIEGAEFHLYADLIKHGMHRQFSIICGTNNDVQKVGELADKVEGYYSALHEAGIFIHQFSEYQGLPNANIKEVLQSNMANLLKGALND